MKVVLISMPDVAPIIVHEAALHMPNLGIACVGGNIDPQHEVCIIDLIRKRRQTRAYLTRTLMKIRPSLVGLSAMTWQFDTCVKIARLVRTLLPETKIVLGGYHATLMAEEIAASPYGQIFDYIIRGEGEEACPHRQAETLPEETRGKEVPDHQDENKDAGQKKGRDSRPLKTQHSEGRSRAGGP